MKLKFLFAFLLSFFIVIYSASEVNAFCGFFVAKADTRISNSSSRVVIAREGNRSVFMMANDYQGDVKDFARIVPIPVIPTRDRVSIGNPEILDRLESFTAPRLVQYVDDTDRFWKQEWYAYARWIAAIFVIILLIATIIWGLKNPDDTIRTRVIELCVVTITIGILTAIALPSFLNQAAKSREGINFGQNSAGNVTVEDRFTLGEYEITLLSAEESDGLIDWLISNDYQVPDAARSMFRDYIENDMKFFVVRVNLEAFQKEGYGLLRPIVLDYESPKFMLPIRLGTLNASGDQDLIIHVLSPDRFAEVTNYRTTFIPSDTTSRIRHPSGEELPAFVRGEFGDFYEAMFQNAYEEEGKNVAFLEYAGSLELDVNGLGKCDPCTIPPEDLIRLQELLKAEELERFTSVTRLHVRYSQATFPEDLTFEEISAADLLEKVKNAGKYFYNRADVIFQGRYVIRRPENDDFALAKWRYRTRWDDRWAKNLAELTGWQVDTIHQKMAADRKNVDRALKQYRRGKKFANSGKWEAALAEYNGAIEIDPGNAGIWFDRGLALLELDRPMEALNAFDRTVALNGNHWEAMVYGRELRQGLQGE
ncbi:MAG: DUF2330 domain-containing protein [Cyanobacteriota bacterium]|nr:DUF2330 domain-containing protein [Cyanobacteriota bacterium]